MNCNCKNCQDNKGQVAGFANWITDNCKPGPGFLFLPPGVCRPVEYAKCDTSFPDDQAGCSAGREENERGHWAGTAIYFAEWCLGEPSLTPLEHFLLCPWIDAECDTSFPDDQVGYRSKKAEFRALSALVEGCQ